MTRDTKSLDDLFCEYEIKLDNKNYTLKGTPKALISVEKKFGALNTILSKELTIEENAFITSAWYSYSHTFEKDFIITSKTLSQYSLCFENGMILLRSFTL